MAEQPQDIWKELRKAFPKEAIGKIPKGGIQVDFVGHAAVTDRLNTVAGPDNWNWEPLAFDESGLPKLDSKGNLWIKLSIREPGKEWVTRLGYGDGSSSVKELIGDALRNAAMRFGIALDLWSKEELESTLEDPALKNERATTRQPAKAAAQPAQPAATDEQRTPAQFRKLFALFNEAGYENREDRLKYLSWAASRTIESSNDLTKAEAAKAIDALEHDIAEAANEEAA